LKAADNRRNFIKFLPYILAGSFAYPAGKFLFFSDTNDTKVSVPIKDIKNGITHLQLQQLFIYKEGDVLEVFNAHCTHMGCILHFNQQSKQFNCPCHKSRFAIDGTRLRGPAKRDLDKITYKIKNKTLYIG